MTPLNAMDKPTRTRPAPVPGISRLLLPLDHSPFAEHAVYATIALAKASGAEVDVVLVHRIDEMHLYGDEQAAAVRELARDEQYVRDIAERIAREASVPTTHALLRGGVVASLSARAHEAGAGLIVMASHGRTGVRRAWLGSVADGLVRGTHIPVLMVRPPIADASPAPVDLFRSIVIPVDGSIDALAVLDAAVAVARCCRATIHLIRVVRPVPLVVIDPLVGAVAPVQMPDGPATRELVAEAAHEVALAANILRDGDRVHVEETVVVDEHVARAILDFATSRAADLIAISTHGRGASRLVVGSVVDQILDHSRLPVLLQRPGGVATPAPRDAR